uniref:Uncharacterized protein n=1 Tax=Heterorhabditis bacteriophora TaxID=37862 RepID=A0A1I7XGN7_HETBA
MLRVLNLMILSFTFVTCQLGLGGLYGNPYGFGYNAYPMGMGLGLDGGMGGLGSLYSPYGYGNYYRCRNLLGGYNPLYSGGMGLLGKK